MPFGFLLIAVLVWVAALAGWWIVSRVSQSADADKLKSRVLGSADRKKKRSAADKTAPALIEAEDRTTGKFALRLLNRLQMQERVNTLIEQAGLKWKAARLIHGCLASFLAGYVVFWLFAPPEYRSFGLLAALPAGALPLLYVLRVRARRLHKFEELFPDSLEFVARSMRAGHAFSVSLEMIHREFQEPLAGEFRRTFEEHNLGLPLDVALVKFSQRVPSLDVHFFVSAVLLQKRTGGNLAEILDKLAYVIRERFKLRGKIRAISAHGKMTGTALSLIPVAVAVLNSVINPGYGNFFLEDEVGRIMLGCAVLLQIIGYGVIRKIVAIEV